MELRNICIIAHVDHGKTTLVDHLLRQSGSFREHKAVEDRVMDSMDLERERGITIQAKNASIYHKDLKVNVVDTPGHADFGGEVERILDMVDGAILLVDGAEGPLPQTRFVLEKALKKNMKVLLVINKVDRPECRGTPRVSEVVDQVFELFIELGASDDQADFPIVYACAREGWSTPSWDEVESLIENKNGNLSSLFELIENYFQPPVVNDVNGAQLLISNIGWSDYVGRLGIGKLRSGILKVGDPMIRWGINSSRKAIKENFRITKLFTYRGLDQIETDMIEGGDIAVLAGCEDLDIGDTIAGNENVPLCERIDVEKPTLSMIFSVNTSPLSGQEGEAVQSRKLKERLDREARTNVAIRIKPTELPDQFQVLGRGELQLSVLIEQMRREGLEFMVGKPLVLTEKNEDGQLSEPIENAVIDVPSDYSGDVTRIFQERKGILQEYTQSDIGHRVRLFFEIPTRGLIGLRSRFLTATRGEGILTSRVKGMGDWKGEFLHRSNGAMVCDRSGKITEYALLQLEDRGVFFVKPGGVAYEGMIIGEFNKENDLNVNPTREKKLTNVRAAGSDATVTLRGTRDMSLENCIEWIDEDEWIEVTPKSVRLRKKVLRTNERSVKRK